MFFRAGDRSAADQSPGHNPAALRAPRAQLAEQLVEVPTVVSQSFLQQHVVEQNVDISVPGARGLLDGGGLQGARWLDGEGLHEFPAGTRSLFQSFAHGYLDIILRISGIWQSLVRCLSRPRSTRIWDLSGRYFLWFYKLLVSGRHFSVSASPEELRKIGLVWEMT